MADTPTTDPKTKAQLVRLALELANTIREFETHLRKEAGQDLGTLAYYVGNSGKTIREEALSLPGLRIAVFPVEDKTDNPQSK